VGKKGRPRSPEELLRSREASERRYRRQVSELVEALTDAEVSQHRDRIVALIAAAPVDRPPTWREMRRNLKVKRAEFGAIMERLQMAGVLTFTQEERSVRLRVPV
jgi:hypothetical protein